MLNLNGKVLTRRSLFSKGVMPEVYVPTVFENYVADCEVDGTHYEVGLYDTAGQEDYDRLRPLSYPDADGIVITFAIDNPGSLDNVQVNCIYLMYLSTRTNLEQEKWISEILHFCPGTPILLMGCKQDLRHDSETILQLRKEESKPVTTADAQEVRKRIGAIGYVETSSKTGEGVRNAMEVIIRGAIEIKRKRHKEKWKKRNTK